MRVAAVPSGLAQKRVEISVLIVARPGERRQELGAAPRGVEGKGEGFAQRALLSCEKRGVLRLEDRAGCVKQHAAASEASPQRVEKARLLPREAVDIGFAAKPFDVGMPARDTGRRAGDVRQDA